MPESAHVMSAVGGAMGTATGRRSASARGGSSGPGPRGGRGGSRPADLPPAGSHRVRTCAGCGRRVEGGRDVLVRLVFGPDGELAVDSGEGSFGRGTYVHPSVDCVRAAGARGVARRRPAVDRSGDGQGAAGGGSPLTIDGEPLSAASLAGAITSAYRRRLGGLAHAARRARAMAVGSDAACAAIGGGDAALVVVAHDAAAAADRSEVRAAIAAGRAVSWGSKRELGELVGGGREDGVAVVAILEPRIAAAMRDAVHVVDGLRGLVAAPGSTAS